jgi:methyl-accepting chemotaxis protein
MNLFHKILVAPAVSVVFLLVLSGVSYQSMNAQHKAQDELYNTRMQHLKIASDTRAGVLDVHSRTYRLMTWADSMEPKKFDADSKLAVADAGAIVTKFGKFAAEPNLSDDETKLGKQIGDLLVTYRKNVAQSIDLILIDLNTALTAMQNADDNFKKLSELADELVKIEDSLAKTAFENADAANSRAIMTSLVVMLLAIAGSIGVSFIMARGISRRVSTATASTCRIAEGDLTVEIVRSGSDEVGQMLEALHRMQQRLREVIGDIANNAGLVHESANSLSTSADQISQSVHSQSEAVSSTAAAVEEMTVSISQVSDNANSARNVAEQTAKIATDGKHLVDGAAAEINKISDSVGTTGRSITELQASSQQISQIANVIKEIAEQTNLLALNAAIEAARAGEQGRGFAVVADEVRKLAERTGRSTHEIKQMIDTIQVQTNEAVTQMDNASHQVETGVTMIRDLQKPLEVLAESSAAAVASLIDLSNAAHEQSDASTQIAQNVERIAQAGEENSAVAANSRVKAQDLNRMADSLLELVKRFRR